MAEQNRALVSELAQLAQLALEEGELELLGGQLQGILGYIQCLQTVDVEGVPEYQSATEARSGLRDDLPRVGAEFDAERALEGVPVRRDRFVAVPKFKADAGEG